MNGQGHGTGFGGRLRNCLRTGCGSCEEYALGVRLYDIQDIVPALEETVGVDRDLDHRSGLDSLSVTDYSGHQDEKVEGDLRRLAGQGILGLDDDLPLEILTDLRYASADEMHAAFHLGLDIERMKCTPLSIWALM